MPKCLGYKLTVIFAFAHLPEKSLETSANTIYKTLKYFSECKNRRQSEFCSNSVDI